MSTFSLQAVLEISRFPEEILIVFTLPHLPLNSSPALNDSFTLIPVAQFL